MEREELFERFLAYLQAEETAPTYLGSEPEEPIPPFDPYRMVEEWIALRHEVKQQGKLLKSTQSTLHKALEVAQTDKEQLQSLLESSQQREESRYAEALAREQARWEKEQEGWLRDLLAVVDALEQACTHWQKAEAQVLPQQSSRTPNAFEARTQKSSPATIGQRIDRWLAKIGGQSQPLYREQETDLLADKPESELEEILSSQREGVELIRRMLLEVLRQRQVVPIEAIAQPFDPTLMYAVSRIESDEAVDNTVAQEVVRGYLYKGRILREAKVIVFQSKSKR
jgi:molecular chaperone GrpE